MATENLKKAAKQETKELNSGYDEAVDEKESPSATVNIIGKDFTIPKKAPAWVSLFIARYGRGKQKDVPEDKYMDFLVKLLGDDVIDHIFEVADDYFDNSDLEEEVIKKIIAVWTNGNAPKKK